MSLNWVCKIAPAGLLQKGVAIHYDMAKEYYDKFHTAGTKVIAKINYLEDAIVAEKAGADVIITKGMEGGGHCTKIGARVLLAEVTEHMASIPVVASGGIATPRQAAACTVLGAEGIEMGTAFMASEECPDHPNVKQAIVKATDRDIVVCGISTGEPSWQIRNKLADRPLQIEAEKPWSEATDIMLISDHPKDCMSCERNRSCELQELGYTLGIQETRMTGQHREKQLDISPSITRDTTKCVLCRRCVTVCRDIQKVGAISAQNRGFNSVVSPTLGLTLDATNCSMCEQCTKNTLALPAVRSPTICCIPYIRRVGSLMNCFAESIPCEFVISHKY